ncbi:MAG: autotransporter outer membrane beta-barrel domain-containing protein [Pseudomonadota bacterium]
MQQKNSLLKAISLAALASALSSPPLQADCSINGSTATCNGDESGGISETSPDVETLDVNSLTDDITPDSGDPGVSLVGKGSSGDDGDDALGTSGDGGNDGSSVDIDYEGGSQNIVTSGESAEGVVGQSIGGSGGDGGEGAGIVGLGGGGGNGGDADDASVESSGTITTSGDYSHGILAVSQGGDAGDGGEGDGIDGDGGDGGDGGDAGTASVINRSTITTNDDSAQGIYTQSLGGAGGDAGDAGGIGAEAGDAGSSADGGQARVTNFGNIFTKGDDANGILVQSLGGFGGDGGGAGGLFAFGSSGVLGASGGSVTVTNKGDIRTSGATSYGILAQSIGGDGGRADDTDGLVAVGGDGAGGGAGSTVNLTNSGDIITKDTVSLGILVQSVGGGGGDAGNSIGLASIGGSGDAGADGGAVSASNSGTIETQDDGSIGILVQSVGGGGGHGGDSDALVAIGGSAGGGGDGQSVSFTNTGDVSTEGDRADAISVQSIGGGGGKGGSAASVSTTVSIAVGGSGGSGGAGGEVQLNVDNTSSSANAEVSTVGDHSTGVLAHSTGGGGGSGGWALSASGGAYDVSVAVGGKGSDGGDGGRVQARFNGSIETQGDHSAGLSAQSAGGGGGSGGFAVSVAASAAGSLSVGVGGDSGGGGNGDKVDLKSWSDVETQGDHSPGIVGTSVGGGGGSGGFSVSVGASGTMAGDVSVGGSTDEGGNSSSVNLISRGDVSTAGVYSYGLQAQSVGGGGGNGGFAVGAAGAAGISASVGVGGSGAGGGTAGQVKANSRGDIATGGAHSHGILAQSLGGGGGSGGFSVSATVAAGAGVPVSVGGSSDGGGDGSNVEVISKGDISTSGSSASAIYAQSLGGGGGSGGFSVAAGITIDPDGPSATTGVSVGGSGSGGGIGDTVEVESTGDLQTGGANASAIFAQSVGGGGGDGGFSVEGTLTIGADGGGSIGVSLGGSAGDGGTADQVSVSSAGTVITAGNGSSGILAQSVGGSGGNGGFSVAGGVVAGGDGGSMTIDLGGAGGSGNTSGDVKVKSEGEIRTSGDNAAGILAQSVGGGGGNGGFAVGFDAGEQADVTVTLGGTGGPGNKGDRVAVDNSGRVVTEGKLSYGVQAQSIGGGGGNGGFAISGDLSTSVSMGAAIGGGAGSGEKAKKVTLSQSGSVTTRGEGAHGLLAQSIGGGGGNGGFAGTAEVTFGGTADVGVAVGGGAGSGASAGNVEVESGDGTIVTRQEGSIGIYAQSVGGGGGDGGFGFTADLGVGNADGDGPTTNVGVALGGSGGRGGTGGSVSVTNDSSIATRKVDSHGIQAQSLGGGGGNGGLAIAGSVSLSTTTSNNLNVSVGGTGGKGHTADDVVVDNSGDVTTQGGKSRGIFAQSVGGGGGNGGLSFSGSLAGGGTAGAPKNIEVSVGGNGGTGADGGEVTLINRGDVETLGYLAEGILAQSVGGGGGSGGLAADAILSYTGNGTNLNVSVAVGGTGAAGGEGDRVRLLNQGSVSTNNVASTAIYAQSVGGGGGNGGSSFTGVVGFTNPTVENPDERNLTVNVAVGGNAGDGASGGKVRVNNQGALTTTSGSSKGIFAQSVGGGGGSGGASDAFSMQIGSCSNPALAFCDPPDPTDKSMDIEVSIGGSGGEGGHGREVRIKNSGAIQTSGAGSDAIYAQSVGAGGGEGGNGELGQNIITGLPGDLIGDIQSFLDPPILFWQEIDVNVGGTGGAAGNGGQIVVGNSNTLITSGNRSAGIFAQSIGGGGGQGGNSEGAGFGVSVGGSAGAAGDGDSIAITNSGDIATSGNGSMGIFAQSIGGGGGVSGSVSQDILGIGTNFGIGVSVSEDGGFGGNGADVTIISESTIATEGAGGHAIWAQSIGGGGGLAGETGVDLGGLDFAGSAGDDGDAGDVTVTHNGDIVTHGRGAAGIFAQSASGDADGASGDGSDDYALSAQGVGGTVNIEVDGTIQSRGKFSKGIVAQSVGLNGNGNITVTTATESVISGGRDPNGTGTGQDAVAIQLLDGADNLIDNQGLVTTRNGVDGIAIEASEIYTDAGNTTPINNSVNNAGTIIGSIILNGDSNSLTNSGLIASGSSLDLNGNGNRFRNRGIISPGDQENIATTGVTGRYRQTAAGTYLADIAFADNVGEDESDLLDVTGVAHLGGKVTVNVLDGAFIEPDAPGETIILRAAGEIGTAELEAVDTAVVDYELRYGDNNRDVLIGWEVDFSAGGSALNRNQSAIATYITRSLQEGAIASVGQQAAQSEDLTSSANNIRADGLLAQPKPVPATVAPDDDPEDLHDVLNALLEAPDAATLSAIYNQLSPEPYAQTEAATVLSNLNFGRSLLDCPQDSEALGEEACGWIRFGGQQAERDGDFEDLGYSETALDLDLGLGGYVTENTGLVFGLSAGRSFLDTEGFASSRGYRFQAGAGVSYRYDATTFSTALIGGAAFYDVERNLTLVDPSLRTEGDQELYFGSGQLRVAHETDLGGGFTIQPSIEGWAGYFYQAAFSETGGGGANLDVESNGDFFAAIRPGLAVVGDMDDGYGNRLRPFIGGGVSYLVTGDNEASVTARLQGDDNQIPGFTVESGLERAYFDAEVGVEWVAPEGMTMRISGNAQIAKNYRSLGGSVKFVLPF